eukprot:scaffold8272_cov42-Prasinocladus_malaysianus.AAC.1
MSLPDRFMLALPPMATAVIPLPVTPFKEAMWRTAAALVSGSKLTVRPAVSLEALRCIRRWKLVCTLVGNWLPSFSRSRMSLPLTTALACT